MELKQRFKVTGYDEYNVSRIVGIFDKEPEIEDLKNMAKKNTDISYLEAYYVYCVDRSDE